jgi:hypothetical protein
MMPPRPNFFIVGGPKCGTTALYQYLRQHPEVFMPARKEFRPAFQAANLNSAVRRPRLRGWMKFSPATRALARAVMTRRMRRGLAETLHQLNQRQTPSRPMAPALRRRLQAEFAAGVAALGTLLDRDLSQWTRDSEG